MHEVTTATTIYTLDEDLSSFLETHRLQSTRKELNPAEGAAIDQIQAGIYDLWAEADLYPDEPGALDGRSRKYTAALTAMLVLEAVESRTLALLCGRHVTHQEAAGMTCVLDEVRLALLGFLDEPAAE